MYGTKAPAFLNLNVDASQFKKLSGTDFKFDRKGDSGKEVHYQNCGKCATVMVAKADAMPGVNIVKGGTVDDPKEDAKHKPMLEIYRRNAPEWCTPWSCAEQKEAS